MAVVLGIRVLLHGALAVVWCLPGAAKQQNVTLFCNKHSLKLL